MGLSSGDLHASLCLSVRLIGHMRQVMVFHSDGRGRQRRRRRYWRFSHG